MLTQKEREHIYYLNKKNGYGMSYSTLKRLIKEHMNGTNHQKELIEERLEDINFHYENGFLYKGKEKELLAELKKKGY